MPLDGGLHISHFPGLGHSNLVSSFHVLIHKEICQGVNCTALVEEQKKGLQELAFSRLDTIALLIAVCVQVLYVGGGGRMRGQNRSAEQSFHQDWSNLTNATLKRAFEKKKPIRFVPLNVLSWSSDLLGTDGLP